MGQSRVFAPLGRHLGGPQGSRPQSVGYWLWEPATGLVPQTLVIPRDHVLEYAFRTGSYRLEVSFNADGSWS
jgi:hypothetical protein